MTVKPGTTDTIAFAADGMSGTAGAAALKKVQSLANAAPIGKAFAAIATLSDLSLTAESHLRAGTDALGRGDLSGAQEDFSHAVQVMGRLATEAFLKEPARTPDTPGFLRRS